MTDLCTQHITLDALERYLRLLDLLRESTPVLTMPEFEEWLKKKIHETAKEAMEQNT